MSDFNPLKCSITTPRAQNSSLLGLRQVKGVHVLAPSLQAMPAILVRSVTFVISALTMAGTSPSSGHAVAKAVFAQTVTVQWGISFRTHLAPSGLKTDPGVQVP